MKRLPRRAKTTDPQRIQVYRVLSKAGSESRFWKAVAEEILKKRRRRRTVNITHLSRSTSPNDSVIVAGKILGTGAIRHPITVGAYSCSQTALKKIEKAGGKVLPVEEMAKRNPSGRGLKILG